MAQVSKRHPSRDPRPVEWENLPTGVPGLSRIRTSHGGIFEPGEIEQHEKTLFHPLGEGPSQGRLFNAEKLEQANRIHSGRSQLMTNPATMDKDFVDERLGESEIPSSHLQQRYDLKTGVARKPSVFLTQDVDITQSGVTVKPWGQGTAGWYRNSPYPDMADMIAVDPTGGRGSKSIDTFTHEMGHRYHISDIGSFHSSVTGPLGMNPDPLKEGTADAYVDRYGGASSLHVKEMQKDIEHTGQKFPSYQYTGYGTAPERLEGMWNPKDRAIYAGSRAHFSETGEKPIYTEYEAHEAEYPASATSPHTWSDPKVDATLHTLLSAGPHVGEALQQTGLADVGAAAFRRHRDRQLMHGGQEVQHALFDEVRGMTSGNVHGYTPSYEAAGHLRNYDTSFGSDMTKFDTMAESEGDVAWPEHMSHNQFGEAPRTARDVGNTLGVTRRSALGRGFT